jgi:hypothetical protein
MCRSPVKRVLPDDVSVVTFGLVGNGIYWTLLYITRGCTLQITIIHRPVVSVSVFTNLLVTASKARRSPYFGFLRYSKSNSPSAFKTLQITAADASSKSRLHTLDSLPCLVGPRHNSSGWTQRKTPPMLLYSIVEFVCCRETCCFLSRCPVTAVVWMLVALSLASNKCICHSTVSELFLYRL